jgi:hypothetical protein
VNEIQKVYERLGTELIARTTAELAEVGAAVRAVPDDLDPVARVRALDAELARGLEVVERLERDVRAALAPFDVPVPAETAAFVAALRESFVQGRHDLGARLAVVEAGR